MRRRASLVLAAGLVAGSALLAAPAAQAVDTGRGEVVAQVQVAGSQTAEAFEAPLVDALASTDAASTTPPEASTSPSGGYAWLAAAGFVLLVVGSIGRIVGLRILYKNRKNKGL
ncbi:hypothetical protein Sked_01000 [Sanguibacter keddieii DSM 10542]|uniref:Uncharacterized protein n=1 Tax=Sanguibacter keddieii (strain ATCC 51767 / DSM 10542 / NCFB 3025 / ST-74) TaxID=446469 RepID=D1BIN1_SANKS|nr:hypothetical protein Sked_01000 [Sanguibacter keddieii DSM 10542]